MNVNKRFPADVDLNYKTFLNDKKINGNLYAYLQSISYPSENGDTIINKVHFPTLKVLCEKIGIKDTRTAKLHLLYLIQSGYLVEDKEKSRYILPEMEKCFLMVPLETIRFLNSCMKEHVVKIYLYLYQRYKYKKNYVFTLEEIGQHLGLKLQSSNIYRTINDALICLNNNGLIVYKDFFDGKTLRKRLLDVSDTYRRNI